MTDIEKDEKALEEIVGKKRAGSIMRELELMRKGSNIAAQWRSRLGEAAIQVEGGEGRFSSVWAAFQCEILVII